MIIDALRCLLDFKILILFSKIAKVNYFLSDYQSGAHSFEFNQIVNHFTKLLVSNTILV